MPFDWGEYVRFAQELVAPAAPSSLIEARFRTVGSRLYYGVYGLVCCYLGDRVGQRQKAEPQRGSHEVVTCELEQSDSETELELAEHVKTLKKIRVLADYRNSPSFSRTDADTAQLVANRALSTLRELEACASESAEAE